MTRAGSTVPTDAPYYMTPLDHCEAETWWGDRCRNAPRFVLRCRNSGSRYEVCATHRRTGVAHGDTFVGEIHRCPSCEGHGWLIQKETANA